MLICVLHVCAFQDQHKVTEQLKEAVKEKGTQISSLQEKNEILASKLEVLYVCLNCSWVISYQINQKILTPLGFS